MEREYRLLIDVGKFAVYQTDGLFFFFCIPPPSDAVRKGWGGPCLEPPDPPRLCSSGASRQGQGQVHLQAPGSELLLQLSEIPGKRVKGGDPRSVIAHSIQQNGGVDFTSAVFSNVSPCAPLGRIWGRGRNRPRTVS